MAIYHVKVNAFSRSKSQTSVAAAAYRAGILLRNAKTNERHDYRLRRGVEETRYLAPGEAPEWALDPRRLWNEAEAAEKRVDATVAREFEIALPHELDKAQRSKLASALSRELVQRYGFAVQSSIHTPPTEDGLNYHVHILATTRRIGALGLTEKTRELDCKKTGPKEVLWSREMVARVTNEHLALAGFDVCIDHRTLAARAAEAQAEGRFKDALVLSRVPTRHLGKAATAMERAGTPTRLGDTNAEIAMENTEALAAALSDLDRIFAPSNDAEQIIEKRTRTQKADSSPFDKSAVEETQDHLEKPTATVYQIQAASTLAMGEIVALWEEPWRQDIDRPMPETERIVDNRVQLLAIHAFNRVFAFRLRGLVRYLRRLKAEIALLAGRALGSSKPDVERPTPPAVTEDSAISWVRSLVDHHAVPVRTEPLEELPARRWTFNDRRSWLMRRAAAASASHNWASGPLENLSNGTTLEPDEPRPPVTVRETEEMSAALWHQFPPTPAALEPTPDWDPMSPMLPPPSGKPPAPKSWMRPH